MAQVLISSDTRYPINKERIKAQVDRSLEELKVSGVVEVSVSFVGDRKMKELNKTYKQVDYTTDVLSFPLEQSQSDGGFLSYPDNVLRLGDIIVSYSQAVENASVYNKLVDDEIDFLIDHSVKHLLGIHHEGD